MAAVEVLSCFGVLPKNDYGSTTIPPWTIGWDEEDTRIRLRFIAKAWVASRPSKKPAGAYWSELVRERCFSSNILYAMAFSLSFIALRQEVDR